MRISLKRGLTAVAVVAMVASVAQFLTVSPAFANGTLQGAATTKAPGGTTNKQAGNSATPGGDFTLRLPAGASCEGDGPNDGYRWSTYMVPSSVDPATLTFDSSGPVPLGTGASFRQPLYKPTSDPIVEQSPAAASPPPGPGPIINIPDATFAFFSPGQVPAGVYNLGIACTLGPASATQMKSFWNVQMTISTDAVTGGPAQIHWENGTSPAAPVLTSVTPSAGQVSVAYTQAAANPALTNCRVTVATSAGGPEAFFANSPTCTSPVTVTGLANGTQYFVRATATNSVGTSVASNELSATPNNPAVTGLTATPSPNAVALDWNDAPSAPASYTVAYCTGSVATCTPASGSYVASATPTVSNVTITPLTAGQLYTFTVTYGPAGTSSPASVQGTPLSNAILLQDLTVSRPNGALVLTQVCGNYGAVGSEPASLGFSAFAADTAVSGGTAPTTGTAPGGPADSNFSGYPYPEDANGLSTAVYPTHCGVNLGVAKFVKSGTGAGQFFAASGRLNQVTIVDTRDTDPGWTVNMTMGQFSAGPGKDFSGNQLGWTLQTTDTAAFTDGSNNTYDQAVTTGTNLAPNTVGGAASPHMVATVPSAPTPHMGLGIATLDARLKLLIPVHEQNGTYTGQLTINAV
ncbi:MAG: hypothetical protein H0U92_14565 [Actinobacteria bacterium]|nr:hypothetical protein [Actinomycetota bacterium]